MSKTQTDTTTCTSWNIEAEHEDWTFTGTYEAARMWAHANARGATISPN